MGRMGQVLETGEVHTGSWWGYLRKRDNLEDLRIDGTIKLKLIIRKWDGEAWTGLLWLRIVTGGMHL
jgi:hypothetical protein